MTPDIVDHQSKYSEAARRRIDAGVCVRCGDANHEPGSICCSECSCADSWDDGNYPPRMQGQFDE